MARLPEPRLGRLPGSSHWPRWSRIPAGDVLAGRGRGIYSTPSRPGRRCGSGPGCGSWAHTPPGGQRGGDLSPRVEIAQSADLSPVMIYLGERARDEVRGRARGTRRAGNAHAASWRLRSIRVPSGRHFELVITGPLDHLAEPVPAVTQRGDGLGSAGEDRVMGQVRGRPAAGHGARPAQEVDVAQTAWHRPYVPVQPGDGGHRDRGWLRDLEVGHPFAGSERVRCPALVLPANAPGRREWLPEELIIGQDIPGAGKGAVLD